MPDATPIVYSFYGVGSGKLGSIPFQNAPFAFTFPANTGQIYQNPNLYPAPAPQNLLTGFTGTFSVYSAALSRLHTAIIEVGLTITAVSIAQSQLFRVSVGLDPDLLIGVANPTLANYGLNISVEPVIGAASFSQQPYPTTAGSLLFTAVSSAEFHATLAPA